MPVWPESCYDKVIGARLCRGVIGKRESEEVNALGASPRMKPRPDEQPSAAELLQHTPLDQLEQTVQVLKLHCSAAEVRQAMIGVFGRVPRAEFETLKGIYLRHCADAPR
jgi:hypothetical protein